MCVDSRPVLGHFRACRGISGIGRERASGFSASTVWPTCAQVKGFEYWLVQTGAQVKIPEVHGLINVWIRSVAQDNIQEFWIVHRSKLLNFRCVHCDVASITSHRNHSNAMVAMLCDGMMEWWAGAAMLCDGMMAWWLRQRWHCYAVLCHAMAWWAGAVVAMAPWPHHMATITDMVAVRCDAIRCPVMARWAVASRHGGHSMPCHAMEHRYWLIAQLQHGFISFSTTWKTQVTKLMKKRTKQIWISRFSP